LSDFREILWKDAKSQASRRLIVKMQDDRRFDIRYIAKWQ